ncbi:hypothetical protein [Geobacter sp.]|uniref:hypothetical protein n=1 Tax=Geobacter sp. TaxID=46610 RepID=UPI00261052F1|nr:hypothetical protein [Geobacter sp.]
MKGTLITTTKDDATGLRYGIYLIKFNNKFWIATFDIDHSLLVQVQGVDLSEDKVPEPVQRQVQEWLL